MKEFVHALRQSETMPGIPNSDTIIITSAGSSSKESTEAKRLSEGQQARQSFDGPGRKPTVNKRKAPPPITPSIIKDAGLPSSLATNARQNLPLSPNSPPSPAQGLRDTPVRLKAKRQSKVPVVQEGNEPSHVQHDQLGNSTIDGLGGLNGLSPLEGFLAVHQNEVTSPNEQSAGPARSATLNNLALSESMENVVRRADDISRQDDTLPPPKLVTASTSGPLAYMTDSTKIRWDNGMAEIAKQLKEQNL